MEPKISVITPTIRPEGLKIVQECLSKQTFKDFEWLVEIGFPSKHDLNAAYNRLLKRARGELVVSYQDFIEIQENGLELFWNAYQENKNCFYTAPVGKRKETIEWDWRNHTLAKQNCNWTRWEIDWASAPLKALKEIGGFDEAIDGHWSCDNVNVGCRAELAGYTFDCLTDNKAIAVDHNSIIEHPFIHTYDPSFNNMRIELFRNGLKLDPI